MSAEKIEEYGRRLEAERKKMIAGVKKNETPQDFGSDVDGLDEEANEAEALGNQLAAEQTAKDRINEVDMALNKIRLEKYGICEKCGRGIEENVLDAAPESRFCKQCKKIKSG